MSTICCLTGPTNPSLLEKTVNSPEYTPSAVIFNENLPLSIKNPQHISQSLRSSQNPTNRLVLVNEENEMFPIERLNDHEKLILPCSTRALKRRPSLLEKSRDWARRLMALHRNRRNTVSNEKFRSSCYDFHQNSAMQKNAYHESLHQNLQSFDEDGYLSPMEIKIKLDHLAQEKAIHLPSSMSNKSQQQLLVYSHSSSDISQPIYRCHGPIRCMSTSKCTCQEQDVSRGSVVSDFHRSLSAVDYIDDDEVTEECLKRCNEPDDPLLSLRYLFNEDNQDKPKIQQGSSSRRTPRRSTNTSSISTDSGYCDIPSMTSSKLIPVHLISCTLIPVNVTRTDPMDMHCLPCTCPPASMPLYTNNPTDYDERVRQRRKSSTNSSGTHLHRIVSRPQVELIDHPCSCNQKYYSTMTICPNLSLSSANSSKSMTNTHDHPKQTEKKHFRKKRTQTPRLSHDRFPIVTDDLVAVSRWYKPHLERDVICQALQQAEYGAFALRDSTTHQDCYALSVKVPKFTHDSNIAHYLIEKLHRHHTYHYRIKGTFKEFPTLLSLLTHHSVMPEILPITLNLQQTLAI